METETYYPKPKPSEMRVLGRTVVELASAKVGGAPMTLRLFLQAMEFLHPAIGEAVQGIYCGREGRTQADITGWGCALVFGWYVSEQAPANTEPHIEYAYLS